MEKPAPFTVHPDHPGFIDALYALWTQAPEFLELDLVSAE